MQTLIAKDLLKQTTEFLWDNIPKQKFVLVFDDGEIETNWKDILFSSYFWDFHRRYPNTSMLLKHHVRKLLGKNRLGMKTHLKLLSNIIWSVYDAYPTIDRDILAREAYEAVNNIYNDLTIRLEEYVNSIDILDFMQVVDSDIIAKANLEVEHTSESITKTYNEILRGLSEDKTIFNNPLAKASRSGIVSSGQLLQCIGPRGFLTDTDSTQFKKPILRSYISGFREFHDSLIESRSAAKSLIFSKNALQQAEYFSRRLQMMDQIVRNLHHGDCGSTEYLIWHVSPPIIENGKTINGGDLPNLIGKHYLDDDGILKIITIDDKHLIDKTLKLRTVLECKHPDPYGICSKCFGELALNIPDNTNLGHVCCVSMTHDASQIVLSAKHYDTSANIEAIIISDDNAKFLSVSQDGSSYLLNKRLKGDIKLVINSKEAANITDIKEVGSVSNLNITRVSALTEIGIMVNSGKIFEHVSIPVGFERRMASMSYPLLEYVRANGWTIDDNGNFVIDMKKWDMEEPILSLPLRHYNAGDHSRDVAMLLESTVKDLKKRDKIVSPASMLSELFTLVNSKLNVNLAVLEVILYGVMIVSAEDYNYHLPKPWTDRGIGVKEAIMAYRSLSATMAFEDHKDILTSPLSFMITDRPDHIFDYMLMPDEVIKSNMC